VVTEKRERYERNRRARLARAAELRRAKRRKIFASGVSGAVMMGTIFALRRARAARSKS
jgi:hypothetical protein